jgi:NAD(P)H-hydrate repair Nnr-like enzyme with NAD(P)H-hydrate dehydratase domain
MFSDAAIVLDAGAMKIVCTAPGDAIRFSSPVLLTPHAGEMASLIAASKEDVAANPADTALTAARAWNAVVALKGAITYIAAPDGRLRRHEGGNFGLATSGSGDVLGGLIAGLAARGAPLEQASMWGVALHARAGERLAERGGVIGYLAREIAGEVPRLMAQLAKCGREV